MAKLIGSIIGVNDATDAVQIASAELGGATNYIGVAAGGVMTLVGTAKRSLSLRPQLYAGRVGGVSKPTFVTYGACAGYSFPIFSSDDEELFFRESLPGRWDGASDITGYLVCALAGAEDVNDDFAFQLSWSNKIPTGGVIVNTTTDVTTAQNVETGRAAAYSIYKLAFTIDWDGPTVDATAGDYFAGRIRRVASGGTEVAGEIILLDFYMTYAVDKIFKA